MRLIDAIRFSPGMRAAFVGAGGKSTAMFRLAREMLDLDKDDRRPRTVLVTTTTHLGSWQIKLADRYFPVRTPSDWTAFKDSPSGGIMLVAGPVQADRVGSLHSKYLEALRAIAEERNLPLLIEADGAHLHPLKAPAQHEPVIPGFVTQVIVVAGISGLGKPLSADWVHRPERFGEIAGLQPGDPISEEALQKVLLSDEGGLKDIPPGARKIAMLTQVDHRTRLLPAYQLANTLLAGYDSVIIVSLATPEGRDEAGLLANALQQTEVLQRIEPVAGVILAAGGSTRFGSPKPLARWRGKPLVSHCVAAALQAGLAPVVVVTGSAGDQVEAVLAGLPVVIQPNGDWQDGLSTSIKAGVRALPSQIGAVIFLHADQPQTSPVLMRKLIELKQTTNAPIISPLVDGSRGNPVLFDRGIFSDLLNLEGDVGGKALFSNYQVEWLPWHDPNQALDIDTPADFQKFLETFPERGVNK